MYAENLDYPRKRVFSSSQQICADLIKPKKKLFQWIDDKKIFINWYLHCF